MAFDGPNIASAGANGVDAGSSWSVPNNITTEDGTTSLVSLAGSADTKQMVATIPFSTVPSAAVIDGIVVEWKMNVSTINRIRDQSVLIKVNGSTSPNDYALLDATWLTTTLTWQSYGGTTDKWGFGSLTGADVLAGFTASMKCRNTTGTATNVRIDAARATVYYTAGGTDSGSVTVALVPTAQEAGPYADSGTEVFLFVPSGSDIGARVDAATEAFALTPSVTQEGKVFTDSATEAYALTPSGTEARIVSDAATEDFKFLVSQQGADFATVPIAMTPNGTDTYLSGFRPERRQRGMG
jgi:hypothetical protein